MTSNGRALGCIPTKKDTMTTIPTIIYHQSVGPGPCHKEK